MTTPLQSLVTAGTKLWLDSIDPDLVRTNREFGATGATSNPIIVSDLIKTGRFDDLMVKFIHEGLDDEALAWAMTDRLVSDAQKVFEPVWKETKGNDGWVSFELDPLLEDTSCTLSIEDKAKKYIELAKHWSCNHCNRMIKIPATPGGLAAVEEVVAAGITPNITLIFSDRQYKAARDAVWAGAQRRSSMESVKSVFSIFVSRLDVYAESHGLSAAAVPYLGITNAKRIWSMNQTFWADKKLPLQQEIIFASTGVKPFKNVPTPPAYHYVAAFAGSDIETNPPATNDAVQKSGQTFTRQIDKMPPAEIVAEIDSKVDMVHLEETLMREGLAKFADPFKALLKLIGEKRASLAVTTK